MPQGLVRGLLRTSGTYASGFAAARLARVILYPVLLAVLPPEELGLIGLMEMSTAFVAAFMGLKLENAVTRFYWDWKKENAERRCMGALWLWGTLFNLLVVAAALLLGGPLFAFLASKLPFFPFVVASVIVAFCQWQFLFLLLVLRIKESAAEYSYTYATSELLTATAAVSWTLLQGGNASSYAAGWAAAWLVVTCGILWRLRRHIAVTLTTPALGPSLRFSLPLIPRDFTSLSGGFLDRFFLDKYLGTREIGLYTAGTKIGAVVLAANSPIKHAWIPS